MQHDSVCIRKINGSFSGKKKKKKKKKLPTALNNSAEMSDSCSKKLFLVTGKICSKMFRKHAKIKGHLISFNI